MLKREDHAEQIRKRRGYRFEARLDVNLRLQRHGNDDGAQRRSVMRDRRMRHLGLTGVDQIVSVVGG